MVRGAALVGWRVAARRKLLAGLHLAKENVKEIPGVLHHRAEDAALFTRSAIASARARGALALSRSSRSPTRAS